MRQPVGMAAPRFQFVTGNEEFLVQRRARTLFEKAAEGLDEWSQDVLDGRAQTVDEVEAVVRRFAEAIQTVSLFGERKAVWLKDISFLSDTVTGRAEGTKAHVEHLQSLLEAVDPAHVTIILSASPADRRKREVKWFEANGESFLEQVGGKGGEDLAEIALGEAKRLGLELTPEAADVLVSLTGKNARLLLEEVRKLSAYAGAERVGAELVIKLVPPLPESEFFAAAEAFFSGNLKVALQELRQHFFAGHDARPLLSTLMNRNRLMLQLAVLRETGALRGRVSKASLESAAEMFGDLFGSSDKSSLNVFTQNPYYLSRLAGGETLSVRALLERQSRLIETLRAIAGAKQAEQEGILRGFVLETLGRPHTASA